METHRPGDFRDGRIFHKLTPQTYLESLHQGIKRSLREEYRALYCILLFSVIVYCYFYSESHKDIEGMFISDPKLEGIIHSTYPKIMIKILSK